ncbi:protein kinase domain-containing protein [Ditylenchus destructor]|nr:protein kinase domain-containing protein [Ditylenchus destructor]
MLGLMEVHLLLFSLGWSGQIYWATGFMLQEQPKGRDASSANYHQDDSAAKDLNDRGSTNNNFQLKGSAKFNRHDSRLINKTMRNLCYCNYGPDVCEFEDTCIKHENSACFHAVRQMYESGEESGYPGSMQTEHFYGCAPLERSSSSGGPHKGSHLTCNAYRSTHSTPSSIACCYEGHFCNMDLVLPKYAVTEGDTEKAASHELSPRLNAAIIFLTVGCLIGVIFILIGYVLWKQIFAPKEKMPTWMKRLKKESLVSVQSSLLGKADPNDNSQASFEYTSGSGSGALTLNERSIALDLTMLETVARGRYGEVCKALYRGSIVAVKTFYTTEEDSWKNERDIYQTQMLNHENVLQYVAADISSNVDSITTMMLITDYHSLGSLYDYLRGGRLLDISEALQISFSVISGIEHLHNAVRGTGSRRKPEIAHRDIKSKNVIVKRAGVCCIADFGLAVRCENSVIIPEKINIQVGTKRYMAPEVLNRSLNINNFDEFKAADIYSFALVMWEVMHRVVDERAHLRPEDREHQRIMSYSSSSGIATGSDRTFNSSVLLNHTTTNSSSNSNNETVVDTYGRIPVAANLNNGQDSNSVKCMDNAAGQQKGGAKPLSPTLAFRHHDLDTNVGQEQMKETNQRPYMLPYQNVVETDPTFEQMRRIVCEQRIRPPIEEDWKRPGNVVMKLLCDLMCEAWNENPKSRHTSLKIKKEMNNLISILHGGENQSASQSRYYAAR